MLKFVSAGRRRRIGRRVAAVRDVGPVLERGREADAARSGRKKPYEFETAWPVPVRIEAGQRAQDPARGVRDQDRVLVVAERAVVAQEVLAGAASARDRTRSSTGLAAGACCQNCWVDDVAWRTIQCRCRGACSRSSPAAAAAVPGPAWAMLPAVTAGECERNDQRARRDLQAFTHALLLGDRGAYAFGEKMGVHASRTGEWS